MNKVSQASAVFVAAVLMYAMAGNVAAGQLRASPDCAGIILTQGASPDDNAPNSNSGTPPSDANPDQGSGDDHAQSPGDDDNGDDDGDRGDSDRASPPDSAQPPGCIFHDRPLELLV